MSKIFIYYSMSGNGDYVASVLKEKGFEIRKVESNYRLSKITFFAMMKGGFDAARGKRAKLINFDNDISNFDDVYIGSPIWNSRLTPPINTVLDKIDLSNKKITFILYSGGGEAKSACDMINEKYKNCKIINLKQPKKYNNEIEKIEVEND